MTLIKDTQQKRCDMTKNNKFQKYQNKRPRNDNKDIYENIVLNLKRINIKIKNK